MMCTNTKNKKNIFYLLFAYLNWCLKRILETFYELVYNLKLSILLEKDSSKDPTLRIRIEVIFRWIDCYGAKCNSKKCNLKT